MKFDLNPSRSGPRPSARRTALTTLGGCAIMVVCLAVGWRMLQDFDADRMWASLGSIGPVQWGLALLATAGSFMALGRYDVIWHRLLRTGVAETRAARVGMAAIAVGQALGANAITSGIARWHSLPDQRPARIATLSAGVGVSFMVAWGLCAVFVAASVGLLPGPDAVIAVLVGVVVIAAVMASPLVWRHAAVGMLAFTAIDLALAGTALWLLLPDGTVIPWQQAIAAYVLALGLGLISNSPGGLGPFELVLLTLLPHVPAEDLVAALLAFRVTYYLVPLVFGAAYLAFAPTAQTAPATGPASWGLARQSGAITPLQNGTAHVIRPFGVSVALGDPVGAGLQPRLPIYKASARTAARARAAGWTAWRIADDAYIDLTAWTLDGPAKKRLRQALRRAEARGITVSLAQDLPLSEMSRIASGWARDHGGELGLTVGRFCPRSLRDQATVLIHHHGQLAGFVTCDVAACDWALDLIRYRPGLPDGAVHVALHHAIAAAQTQGATSFDLGAVPSSTGPLARWSGTKDGLRRFKALYAPVWHPRYFVAPTPARATLTGAALIAGIQRPVARYVSRTHHLHALFDVALRALLRHTGVSPATEQAHTDARQRPFPPSEDPKLAVG